LQGFCAEEKDAEPYAQDLPTKQNILCGRRSVRQVMEAALSPALPAQETTDNIGQEEEIAGRIRDPASFAMKVGAGAVFITPAFSYQVPARRRFVIVLERSNAMGLNSRWSLLHGELFRFIASLPAEEAEVAVVTYGKTASLTLAPTLLTQENREGIYGRIPRRHLDEEAACLDCGLRLALKTLAIGGPGAGVLVVITASAARPAAWSELVAAVQQGGHQVHTITFERSVFYEARQLAGKLGSTHVLHERNHDLLSGLLNLSNIFTSILQAGGGSRLQKFYEELKVTDETNTVAGTLVVEQTLLNNLWVQIAAPDQDDIELFELTSPTGRVHEFPRHEHGLVYFRLEGAQEAGIWSYRARLFQTAQLARVAVIALAEPGSGPTYQLEAWTSVDSAGVNALQTPVKLFARLTSGGRLPVLDAEVVANVHRPGAESVQVVLRDSGSGYPDITQADGVYSAYFTQFTSEPGFYSMSVTAGDASGAARLPRLPQKSAQHSENVPCCGSSLPMPAATLPATAFGRHSLAGSFFVAEASQFYLRQGSPHRNDVFPPSRITNFELANYLDHSLYVTLKWTAPGNDYDQGTAFRYEVRCYTNREALRDENFTDMGILVHASLVPMPETAGREQRSTVGIPWPNEVFYYAIVAYDEEGNRGQVSNVVAVFAEEWPPAPSPPPAPLPANPVLEGVSAYPAHENSQPLTGSTGSNNTTLIYAVSGAVSAVLVAVLVGLLAAMLRARGIRSVKQAGSLINMKSEPEKSTLDSIKPDMSTLDAKRLWREDVESCGKNSMSKSPVPSITDNLSWRYLPPPNKASGQQVAGVHRVHHADQTASSPSTDSSMYSTSSQDSETTVSGEFVVGPRISVLEDYTVYRDLSNLDSLHQDYFSLSQLPPELQGLSLVPYSPGYETAGESSKRRHVSLV
jgi:hypothetical protein